MGMSVEKMPGWQPSGWYGTTYLLGGWDLPRKWRCFENRYYTPWRDASGMEVSANSCRGSLEGDRDKRLALLYWPKP